MLEREPYGCAVEKKRITERENWPWLKIAL